MAETTLSSQSLGVKRNRKRQFCDHCHKEVSKSTYYRHKLMHTEDSDLEEDASRELLEFPENGNEEDFVEISNVSYV